MLLKFVLQMMIIGSLLTDILNASPKYSAPVDKIKTNHIKPPILPSGGIKNYVDFDLKSQSSRFGKDEHHHYGYAAPYDHYYSTYDYTPYYHGKGQDYHYILPYIIGGFGILLLPILTLMLTLAVNIAPASTIPTAVTTATGKFVDSFNSTRLIADIRDRLEAALNKYNKD